MEVDAITDVVEIVVDLNPFIDGSWDVKPATHRKQNVGKVIERYYALKIH